MEKVVRTRGDLGLIGPGIPHYGKDPWNIRRARIVVHFLPVLLFEMGPGGDGARILARFPRAAGRFRNASSSLPRRSGRGSSINFETMLDEFQQAKFGSAMRVRLLLMEVLIELLRWRNRPGRPLLTMSETSVGGQIEKVLHFIYKHLQPNLCISSKLRAKWD